MSQAALILTCLALGVALRLVFKLPDTTTTVLGGWVLNVALPATALNSVHHVNPHPDWWLATAMPWLAVAVAVATVVPLCRILRWPRRRAGALVLLGGFGGTAFIGLPVVAALAGPQWLGPGVVVDLLGSDLALSTVGVAIATIAGSGRLSWRAIGGRMITFPPLIAILLALATNHLDRPGWLDSIIASLAGTFVPIALAAVGFALRLDRIAGRWWPLVAGLGVRLVVVPAAILGSYAVLGKVGDPLAAVTVLQLATPPMLAASILAIENDLEPDLVALVIGIGIPLSLLTMGAWWWVMSAWA